MKRKYLIWFLLIFSQVIVIYFSLSTFFDWAFTFCSTCRFIDNIGIAKFFMTTVGFAIIYSLIGLYLNIRTVKQLRTKTYLALIILTILDIALIPLSMIIATIYFKMKGRFDIELTDIFNLVFMIFIVVCKHILILLGHEIFGKRVRNVS